jgi:hypothetical protein
VAAAVLASACETTPVEPTWAPGPSVPGVATAVPLMWDAAEELAVWATNGASKGPISLEGTGPQAFIRIRLGGGTPTLPGEYFLQVVLRGPDLEAPVRISGLRMRDRWVTSVPPNINYGPGSMSGALGYSQPVAPPYPPGTSDGTLFFTRSDNASAADWRETELIHTGRAADAIRYVYLALGSYTGGSDCGYPIQLDIDWISIERQ